jgi:hypothetical protein
MYWLFWCLLIASLMVCVFGCRRPLPIFGNRRRWAVLAIPAVLFVGGQIFRFVEPEEDRAKRIAAQQPGSWDDVYAHPAKFLRLDDKLSREDGASLILSGRIFNSAKYDIKDAVVRCRINSQSGTKLESQKIIVYKTVPASGSVNIGKLRVGYLDQQAQGAWCQIVGATIANSQRPS